MLRTKKTKTQKNQILLYKDNKFKAVEEKKDIESLKKEVLKLYNKLKNKDVEVKQNEKYSDLLIYLFQIVLLMQMKTLYKAMMIFRL